MPVHLNVLDCIKNGGGKAISIEIEPPKLGSPREAILQVIDPLVKMGVCYINITYHSARLVEHVEVAGRKHPLFQRLHPGTSGIAGAILERYSQYNVFPVPHLICTGFTKYDTEDFLHELACLGVCNVLALRGDGRRDQKGNIMPFETTPGGHSYALDLIKQISQLKKGQYLNSFSGTPLHFVVGAACYPESNSGNNSLEKDLDILQKKIDAGTDYFVSQMFFDCNAYENFINAAQRKGICKTIIPGIKPLTLLKHLELLPKVFSCAIPHELKQRVEKHQDSKEDIRKVGIDWCIEQCHKLRALGAPSLHFYASRKSPIQDIIQALV